MPAVARGEDLERPTQERIARWLEYVKEVRGLTNEGLGGLLGLAEPTITNILNRHRTNRWPGLTVLVRLVHRAGIRADELLGRDPPESGGQSPRHAPSSAQPRGPKKKGAL